jgi:hypothetical protein
MNLIQSTFPLLDIKNTINLPTTSSFPLSSSPILVSNRQPSIWVQQKNGPGNADLVSLMKPFRVHPHHDHSEDFKVKDVTITTKPSIDVVGSSSMSTMTKLTRSSHNNDNSKSNDDMNGYQIYRLYCDYHDRVSFFNHPSIAIAEDYWKKRSNVFSLNSVRSLVCYLLSSV